MSMSSKLQPFQRQRCLFSTIMCHQWSRANATSLIVWLRHCRECQWWPSFRALFNTSFWLGRTGHWETRILPTGSGSEWQSELPGSRSHLEFVPACVVVTSVIGRRETAQRMRIQLRTFGCLKQVSRVWLSNYISHNIVVCNYLFMPYIYKYIYASDAEVLNYKL